MELTYRCSLYSPGACWQTLAVPEPCAHLADSRKPTGRPAVNGFTRAQPHDQPTHACVFYLDFRITQTYTLEHAVNPVSYTLWGFMDHLFSVLDWKTIRYFKIKPSEGGSMHRVKVEDGGEEGNGEFVEALCEFGAECGVCRGIGHARQDALLQVRLQLQNTHFSFALRSLQ